MLSAFQQLASQRGYTLREETSSLTGLCNGVAFRAVLGPPLTLELSVSLPDTALRKLSSRLSSYTDVSVVRHAYGVLVTLPIPDNLSGDFLGKLLDDITAQAVSLAGASHDDRFERYGEPFSCYIRGLFGALVGVLPWLLCTYFFSFQFGYLGFAISMGAFFGYQQCRGAHHTTFAMTCIVLFSLLAVLASQGVLLFLSFKSANPFLSAGDLFGMMKVYLLNGGLKTELGDLLFGLLFVALGFVGIRGRILRYTHEPKFLRRPKKRDDD